MRKMLSLSTSFTGLVGNDERLPAVCGDGCGHIQSFCGMGRAALGRRLVGRSGQARQRPIREAAPAGPVQGGIGGTLARVPLKGRAPATADARCHGQSGG